jgi:hypothetical protein
MDAADHEKFGKRILAYLVYSIKGFEGGTKSITYGELAKNIGYPEPHIGNLFGKNIGETLGVMGHMLDGLKIGNWNMRIPYIQTLVVNQSTNLPSNGLSEFEKDYYMFTNEEKKTFVLNEYKMIYEFGSRWDEVLNKLNITEEYESGKSLGNSLYNPYGSEGSPEHRNVKEFVIEHGHLFGYMGTEKGFDEYPLKSGDFIDVVFRDENQLLGIEVKSKRSGIDDIERGIYQCIKYKAVLEAEKKVSLRSNAKIDCILVVEYDLPKNLMEIAAKLGVKIYKENVNK